MSAPATESEPTAVGATDVRDLVWAAAGGLNPDDRQVFELMVRHGLSAPDVAAVLGISPDHAHARLSRARGQLERALGALLVARTGQQHCAELAVLLRGWDGVLTTLVRKRVSRHVESCPTCAERRRREFQPAALLSGYAGCACWTPANRRPRPSAPGRPPRGPRQPGPPPRRHPWRPRRPPARRPPPPARSKRRRRRQVRPARRRPAVLPAHRPPRRLPDRRRRHRSASRPKQAPGAAAPCPHRRSTWWSPPPPPGGRSPRPTCTGRSRAPADHSGCR